MGGPGEINKVVPVVGLEPTRPFKGPQDFKSCASAISPHRQGALGIHRAQGLRVEPTGQQITSGAAVTASGCMLSAQSKRMCRNLRYVNSVCGLKLVHEGDEGFFLVGVEF